VALDKDAGFRFIADSSLRGYDGSQKVRDEEHSLEEKDAHKGKRTPWTLRKLWGKPLWEWLKLIIVPFVIALSVAALGFLQAWAQNRAEEQRAQRATLQAYLDQMGALLLEHNLHTTKDTDVLNLATARTLTTLDALDPVRTRRVLRFLNETELIQSRSPEKSPVISLKYADLDSVDLSRRGLIGAANLQQADMTNADLSNADLSHTNLSGAHLRGANLSDANLTDANLSGAQGVTNEELERQANSLEGATMPNGQKYEDWLKSQEG
jgi:hypothetical protein